jgi:hypothetical protein
MYFSFYPKVAYKVDDFDYVKAIDITSAATIKAYINTYRGIGYNPYIVKDGERPDSISYKIYGSERYDWIIMMVNNISNVYDQWPKSSEDFREFIILKYGTLEYAINTTKSYYDSLKNEIDVTTYNSLDPAQRTIQTYYEYEIDKNEAKAAIKILNPSLLLKVESDIKQLLKAST